ncbi:hypothetical protein [Luteipulveratus flavus]|uniref:Secreted protein n=1 Tax=Luteipulveratus flavus TaxID=3031728 RepID=A0ABT6C6F9_9MICO|nr:hypothetical protein [Luteipulveratus sp. YIM 133296]MDF8262871.1 hypothetical protein [Luteipulveratus sp. YIM 133296]
MKHHSIAVAALALSASLALAACQDEDRSAAGSDLPVAAGSTTSSTAASSTAAGSASAGTAALSSAPTGQTAAESATANAAGGSPQGSVPQAGGSAANGPQGSSGHRDEGMTGGKGLTLAGLRSAPYPAMCDNPAGRLVNGKDLRGRDGNVEANMPGVGMKYYNPGSKPTLLDLTGDGRKEMVVEFFCDAGGVTWPSVIVVYGEGWKVLGSLDLGSVANADAYYGKARVSSWSVGRSGLNVTWRAFQGIDGSESRRTGVLKLRGGRPVMTNVQILSGHGAGGGSVARTQIRSINPTTSAGGVASGWTTTRTNDSCDGSEASLVAKSSGIFVCGASASGYDACWTVNRTQAACVASPYRKHADLLNLTRPTTARPYAHPVPWGVVLADGTTCQPSFGGGGSVRPDGYIARYYCSDKRDLLMRENDRGAGWFDTSRPVWTVQAGKGLTGKRTTEQVKAVSYAVR